MYRLHVLLLTFAVCLLPGNLKAQERLVAVGRLWVTVHYFHPYLASRSIDWDQALLDALPAIRKAGSDEEFASAVQSMLTPLGDPLTRVDTSGNTPPPTEDASGYQRFRTHHGLASDLPGAHDFYESIAVKPGRHTEVVSIPLDASSSASVRLSEPAVPIAGTILLPRVESAFAENPYPSIDLRILAGFRLWGAIHYFFAYKDLMDEDWDTVFADALPKLIAAKDVREYHLAIAETISRLSDSNSTAQSSELDAYFGAAPVGLEIRLIEKRAAVVRIFDPAAKSAGIKIGDVITVVDGERVSDRIKREANFLSASSAQALSAIVVHRLLNGPEASDASLTIVSAANSTRTVVLKRSGQFTAPATGSIPFSNVVRTVAPGIGYVDLSHLNPDLVERMWDKLRDTTAIIFDARGPIADVIYGITSHLTEQGNISTAIVTGPIALEPDLSSHSVTGRTASYFSFQTSLPAKQKKYGGRTVMLIDERTTGPAEHLGMLMEAVDKTEFLGSPSAGADSDLTNFVLPGGITVTFSGHDIRRANGGPIQRLGLQPSLALVPKISAIRAGKDPVLEKAIEYLRPPGTQAKRRSLDNGAAYSEVQF